MKAGELIKLLKDFNPEAEVYVAESITQGVTAMHEVEGISPITSSYYGSAVVIELED